MKRLETETCFSTNKPVLGDLQHVIKEKALFLHQFAKNPKRVGSITPSSPFLVRNMIEPIQWDTIHTVVELGAGTGVLTRNIEKRRHPESNAIVFEVNNTMRQRLAERYPNMHFRSNAADLCSVMQEMGIAKADCIFSGLPFANFEQQLRDSILDGVISTLKPGGLFITFQYSLQMKKRFEERFKQTEIKFTPFNIPPAFVYYCSNSPSQLKEK